MGLHLIMTVVLKWASRAQRVSQVDFTALAAYVTLALTFVVVIYTMQSVNKDKNNKDEDKNI